MKTTSRTQLWNACLGNLFEHYDTALFGFLSPFLAPLIFPDKEPIVALILTYAIMPLGMLVRPLGSLVFGYIGDVYGRKYALFLTLAGMSFVSGCIALSPTYSQVGIFAPIIFCLGRALQNFLAAGETMGGAIFLLENSSEKHHDLFSGLYSASTMGGHLLASWGVFLLSSYNLTDPGWRFLYLCGCMTALFGCLMRRSPHVVQPTAQLSSTMKNLRGALWTYRRPLLCIMITSGFASATYSIALVLMNGFIPLVSTLSKTAIMKINTYLLILDFCALPFFGWIGTKISREKLMVSASLGVVVFAMPLILSLKGASLMGIIGVRMAFVIFGVAFFAPFHAWAQQLIPSHCRYAVISFGYALGTQGLGSPTAALSLWFFQKTGLVASVSWYWMFLGLLSSGVIALALRTKKNQTLEKVS
jgi:MFS transporter, MHS family, proline/betaine transporter